MTISRRGFIAGLALTGAAVPAAFYAHRELTREEEFPITPGEATVDLGALRTEVEASLRKVEALVNEVNRKWPFARDTEIKLP